MHDDDDDDDDDDNDDDNNAVAVTGRGGVLVWEQLRQVQEEPQSH
jgi:hypothetical protein